MFLKEIEFSINGEINKFLQGSPALFVRFNGCNLHKTPCAWCDTPNSLKNNQETITTTPNIIRNTIISKCASFKPVVVLTGGEPLFQDHDDLAKLISMIPNHNIVIETNGTISPLKFMHSNTNIVIDYKPISSGNNDKMKDENFCFLRQDDIIKFPFATDEDFNQAIQKAKEFSKYTDCVKAFSPIITGDPKNKLNHFGPYALEAAKNSFYFSIQLHKLINVY